MGPKLYQDHDRKENGKEESCNVLSLSERQGTSLWGTDAHLATEGGQQIRVCGKLSYVCDKPILSDASEKKQVTDT